MSKTYSVISHTHWDREWYLPLENFRVKLVHLVDNLLDILDQDENYRFHLDAQTIVLEDYLDIQGQNRDKLKKYISEGRILVGPWYVQNDFFLTSGEATIRNLLIGSEMAEDFGHCTMVGYAPDQFGLISQLPQIFNRFGIDSCIFARGYSFDKPTKSELYWKGEDGSQVLAVYMPFWYNNAQRFSTDIDRAMKMLDLIKNNLNRTATTDFYLLMNGVDHLEAQEDLTPILEEMNKKLPEGEHILQDTMPEYMERLKASVPYLVEYTGEMRNGGKFNLLAGTLSSRVYLKQWNTWCQAFIEKRLEPLYSFMDIMGIKEYPKSFTRYLWKLLIQNHPHDSICGCSVDRVHEHMVDRYKRFEETATDLLDRGMETLSSYISRDGLSPDQQLITVFNTNALVETGNVVLDIDFPEDEAVEHFSIVDEKGEDVPFVVLETKNKVRGLLSPINLPGIVNVDRFTVRLFIDRIAGMSYRTFVATSGQKGGALAEKASGTENVMENEYLKVEIHPNGTVTLYDKESQKTYTDLLMIEDMEDTGDSYVYHDHPESQPYLSRDIKADIKKLNEDALSTSYVVSYTMDLPTAYCFDQGERSKELAAVPVEFTLTLGKASRSLDISVQVDNRVKDHRMRVLLPIGIDTDISQAGSPFDTIHRNKKDIDMEKGTVAQQPNTNYVNVDGNGYGLAIFNEGLHEYENLRDESNTIALTLIRGNGYISRAGDSLPVEDKWMVPGNQCLGVHTFRLALYPHSGDYLKAQVIQKAQSFLNPLFATCQRVDTRKLAGGRPFVQDSEVMEIFFRDPKYPEVQLPLDRQIADLEGEDMVLSCIKKKEKGESIIIRLYNGADRGSDFRLQLYKEPKEAYLVNLKEDRLSDLVMEGLSTVKLTAQPKEIVTLEFVFE